MLFILSTSASPTNNYVEAKRAYAILGGDVLVGSSLKEK